MVERKSATFFGPVMHSRVSGISDFSLVVRQRMVGLGKLWFQIRDISTGHIMDEQPSEDGGRRRMDDR